METLILVALWLFILTHVDTLALLVAFCLDEEYRLIEILIGHYLGFCLGLTLAILAAVLVEDILQEWTFLLGLVPLTLGIWSLRRRRPTDDDVPPQVVPGPLGRVGIVTMAGIGLSGENIALFIPFFVGLSSGALGIVIGLYLLAAGMVFVLAYIIGTLTPITVVPDWIDRLLVPAVLIVVGIYVIGVGIVA